MTSNNLSSLEKLIHSKLFDWDLYLPFKKNIVREGILTNTLIEKNLDFFKSGFESSQVYEVFNDDTVVKIFNVLKNKTRGPVARAVLVKKLPINIRIEYLKSTQKFLNKDDLIFIDKLEASLKNDLIFARVQINENHSFKITDFTGDWNKRVDNIPFYFTFLQKRANLKLNEFLKYKDKFDLKLKVNNECFLTYSLRYNIAPLSKHYLTDSKKVLKLFPEADLLPYIPFQIGKKLALDIYKAYWEKNKVNKEADFLAEKLVQYIDFKSKNCFFLKKMEDLCNTEKVFFLNYLKRNLINKKNIDFLKKNYNFTLLASDYSGVVAAGCRYDNYSDLGFTFDNDFNTLNYLLDIEPLNALFIDLNHLNKMKSYIYAPRLSLPNVKKFLVFHEKVTTMQDNLAIDGLNKDQRTKIKRDNVDLSISTQVTIQSHPLENWATELGLKEALIRKTFYSSIVTPKAIKLNLLEWVLALRRENFNYDRIITFMNEYKDKSLAFNEGRSFLKIAKEFYTEEKIFNLIINSKKNEEEFIYDTTFSLNKINNYPHIKKILKTKTVNSIKQLHDTCSDMISFIEQDNFPLYQDEVMVLENLIVGGLRVNVPKMSHDLIKIGEELNICVGDGDYAMEIQEEILYIITLNNSKNEAVYCIELDRDFDYGSGADAINQAKGFSNKDMSRSLFMELGRFIDEYLIDKEKK